MNTFSKFEYLSPFGVLTNMISSLKRLNPINNNFKAQTMKKAIWILLAD
jgi:hypothetical protein